MKIGFVRVFVTDFDRSLDFYRRTLGMELDYTDGVHWAQFKSGVDVSLAIERCSPDRTEQGSKLVGRFVGVTLMVDDLARQYQLLTERDVEFTGAPEKQAWGGTLAHFRDPDGNVLTLLEEAR
jgi:catechol 2,3-dioxygenase-like lactoylglutathione lyase family enzyme